MSDPILSPEFKAEPYWWEAAPLHHGDSTTIPGDADVVVVGGGYAGLSCALELARSGSSVVVLEADRFGSGASTRNGGSITVGINVGKNHLPVATAAAQELRRQIILETAEAYWHFERVVRELGIDCYTGQVGRYVGAHSPGAFDALTRQARDLMEITGVEVEMISRERQREELGTDYYRGGMLVHAGGGVQPAVYHRGLVDACLGRGAVLCGAARVHAIERDGEGFVTATPRGRVRSRHVVLATNAYTAGLSRWHSRRLIPVDSHMIATETIGEDRLRELMPGLRVYGDTKRIPYYFRPSPDRSRLLFGGRASFASLGPTESARRLHHFAVGLFPQLAGVRVTHAWRGAVAFTFDYLPHMGVHDGVHYCLGCNGGGVIMMTWLGHQVARQLLGRTNAGSAFSRLPFPSRPFYTGRPWFLPVAGVYYRMRDRFERRASA
jgi:glycine/D-amino acid oxidase-like deaminating enzyme